MAKPGPKGPWKYDKDFHPSDFIRLSEQGKNIIQIAKVWKVDQSTIHDWINKYPQFSKSVKRGKEYCEAWYIDLGQAAMIGQATINGKPITFNLGAFVWMTKNVLKWSDKVDSTTTNEDTVHVTYDTMFGNGQKKNT